MGTPEMPINKTLKNISSEAPKEIKKDNVEDEVTVNVVPETIPGYIF